MDNKEILYSFEHDLLPKWFFETKKEFLGVICTQPQALHSILTELFARNGKENPYGPESFKVEPEQVREDIVMVKISFPKPPAAPLCISTIVIFDKTFEKVSYFCIEKGDDATGGFPVVCSWEADGRHINYGPESHDPDDCALKCVNIHMERYYKDC